MNHVTLFLEQIMAHRENASIDNEYFQIQGYSQLARETLRCESADCIFYYY